MRRLPELELDCARLEAAATSFLADTLRETGLAGYVVGLSGGVDSAVTAALALRAVGPERVRAFMLPYRSSSPDSLSHARLVADALGIEWEVVDITPPADGFRAVLATDGEMDAVRMGNICARCRMTVLFDRARALDCLVLGSSNRTESLLGYFTLHGDGAWSVGPIADLYKTNVWDLARHLGLPREVVEKTPTADLWPGQTDEGELGMTYAEVDPLLVLLIDRGLTPPEVAAMGYDAEAAGRVLDRVRRYAFKLNPPQYPRLRDACRAG